MSTNSFTTCKTTEDWDDTGLLTGLKEPLKAKVARSLTKLTQQSQLPEYEFLYYPICRRVHSYLYSDENNLFGSRPKALYDTYLLSLLGNHIDEEKLALYITRIVGQFFSHNPEFVKYHQELDWEAEICHLAAKGYILSLYYEYQNNLENSVKQTIWHDKK